MAARIVIDAEFRTLIPALTEEERMQLMANVLRDGVLAPFIVWKEENILIEGHHRFDICEANELDFPEPKRLSFKSRDDVKVWMIKHAFGGRNLQTFQRVELALVLKPLLKAKGKVTQGKRTDICQNSDKGSEPHDTKKELAKIAGVSHDTIAKGEVIAKTATEEVKAKLRRGDESINHAYKAVKPGNNGHASNGHAVPASRYPSSDDFHTWMKQIISVGTFIHTENGGMENLMSKPTWDHRQDRHLLPLLEDLGDLISQFIKESKEWRSSGHQRKTS